MKRTKIVPRAVFGVSFGGVVPASIMLGLQACSSGPVLGVAAVAMCCFEAGSNDGDADASDATDSTSEASDAPAETTTDATGDAPEGG